MRCLPYCRCSVLQRPYVPPQLLQRVLHQPRHVPPPRHRNIPRVPQLLPPRTLCALDPTGARWAVGARWGIGARWGAGAGAAIVPGRHACTTTAGAGPSLAGSILNKVAVGGRNAGHRAERMSCKGCPMNETGRPATLLAAAHQPTRQSDPAVHRPLLQQATLRITLLHDLPIAQRRPRSHQSGSRGLCPCQCRMKSPC